MNFEKELTLHRIILPPSGGYIAQVLFQDELLRGTWINHTTNDVGHSNSCQGGGGAFAKVYIHSIDFVKHFNCHFNDFVHVNAALKRPSLNHRPQSVQTSVCPGVSLSGS